MFRGLSPLNSSSGPAIPEPAKASSIAAAIFGTGLERDGTRRNASGVSGRAGGRHLEVSGLRSRFDDLDLYCLLEGPDEDAIRLVEKGLP